MKNPTRIGALFWLPFAVLRGWGVMTKMFFGFVIGSCQWDRVVWWFDLCCTMSLASMKGYLRCAILGVDGNGNKVKWI